MLTVGAGDGEDGHQVSTLAVNNLPHLVTHAQLSKETYYHSKRDLMCSTCTETERREKCERAKQSERERKRDGERWRHNFDAKLSKETYYHSKRDLMMEKDGGTTLMHAHE
jgi:hypothetical protein